MRDVAKRLETTRTSGGKDNPPRFILAFEGYRTEVDYFKSVAENWDIAGARSPLDITVLQREEIDAGCSGPVSIVEMVKRNVDAMALGHHTVDTICEAARNFGWEIAGITRHDPVMRIIGAKIYERIGPLADDKGAVEDMEMAQSICESVIKEVTGKNVEIAIPDPPEYIPEVDVVCIIIDRDQESHSSRVMDEFVAGCRRYGFRPYITNPCFEFWLMLHFEESIGIDRDELLENRMIGDKRFTEVELDKIVNGVNPEHHYDKANMDPFMFIHRIRLAIRNSRLYCSDVRCLKREVGTNLGLLLEEIMGNGK